MNKKNEKDKKSIMAFNEVYDVVPVDSEECPTVNNLSPVKAYLRKYIKTDKFKTLKHMQKTVVEAIVKEDTGAEEEYFTNDFNDLDDDSKDIVRTMVEDMYDYEANDIAYARALFQVSKIKGLMEIGKKNLLDDYVDNSLLFQDVDVTGSLTGEDNIDFPQYLNKVEMFNTIKGRMNNTFFKNLIEMMVDMSENDKTIIRTLLGLADMSSDLMNVITILSQNSASYSSKRDNGTAPLTTVDPDEEEPDDSDVVDSIQTGLFNHLKNNLKASKSESKKISADIADALYDSRKSITNSQFKNISYLLAKKHRALYIKSNDEDLVSSIELAYNLLPTDTMSRKEKAEFTENVLPLCYISTILNTYLSEFNVEDILEDAGYSIKEIDDVDNINTSFNSLEDAVSLDLDLGISLSTYIYGVVEKNSVYIAFSNTLLPRLTTEFLDKMSDTYYDGKLTRSTITKIVKREVVSSNEETDAIHLIEITDVIEKLILK